MSSSTSEKFNRIINAKEQIRKAINKKGVRVPETLPLEQYAAKIEAIPFYDIDNEETSGFTNFVTSYFTDTAGYGYQFYNNTSLANVSAETMNYLNQMGWMNCPSTRYAFYSCSNLETVAPMILTATNSCSYMFYSCSKIRSLDLTVASNFTTTEYMFQNCSQLTNLKLNMATGAGSNFTNCNYMFTGSTKLTNSIVSLGFSTYANLFNSNTAITNLDFLNGWDLTSTTGNPSWEAMFASCTNLKDFTFPTRLTYTAPKSLSNTFNYNNWLTASTMSSLQDFFNNIDLTAVTSMSGMFSYPQTRFDGLNLTIHMPDSNQTCSISSMFQKTNYHSYSVRGAIERFSFDGTGSASSLFAEYSSNSDNANYHPTTFVNILDLPNVTSLSQAFYYCSYLTGVQQITTGLNLTSTSSMFYYCKRLQAVPLFITTNVTNMNNMFYYCSALTTVPQFDTSNASQMQNMFYYCSALTEVPILNTSKCYYFQNMFQGCTSLTSIPPLDLGYVDTNSYWTSAYSNGNNPYYYMFYGCSNLVAIHCLNIKSSIDISYSTKFTREALVEVIENLVDVGASRILHMGQTNLDKLTAEDIAIATAKGWTIN